MDQTQSGDALRTTAREAKTEVKDLAHQAKEQASAQAQQLIEQRKGSVIDSLTGVARALQSTASQLENEQQGGIARYASDAASRLEGFSESLKNKDLDAVRRDAESFARERPALFLGGCVAIGFALSRFLKASASRSGAAPAPVEVGDFDAVNAADPGIGVSSEMSFDEPRREPVTSEWTADRNEQSIQESATGLRNDEEWKP